MPIKHPFVNPIPDDPTFLGARPSHWNATHSGTNVHDHSDDDNGGTLPDPTSGYGDIVTYDASNFDASGTAAGLISGYGDIVTHDASEFGSPITDITSIPTVETDTSLRMSPDGVGGVGWVAASSGGSLALDDLTDVNAGAPNDLDVLTWDDGNSEWIAQAAPGAGGGDSVGQFVAGWDGGGSAITANVKADLIAPFSGTITGWTLLADQAGSAVVDIWLDSLANFPPTDADSITAAAPPTLSTATNATDAEDGWDTAVTAGDVLRFNLDSASTVTRLLCVVDYTRP